jgi:polysaccharide export outer membrane protein
MSSGIVVKLVFGVALVTLVLGGCTSLPPLPPPAPPEAAQIPIQQTIKSALPIGPEDVLNIVVYGHDDLSTRVAIAADGTFSYPLLGRVRAAGLMAQELADQLTATLSEYVVDPQVNVTVEQFQSQQVYVIGEVRSPGPYVLKHASTLLEILVGAGGPTPNAGWEVMVVRGHVRDRATVPTASGVEANEAAIRVDLEKLLAGQLRHPFEVRGGDTIYVPTAAFFYIDGQVRGPGRYRLERDTTVAKALTVAGGVTQFAAKSRIKIRRVVAGQRREFRAQMHDLLQADDVLIVPESLF